MATNEQLRVAQTAFANARRKAGDVRITFRIPKDLMAEFKEICAINGQTVGGRLKILIVNQLIKWRGEELKPFKRRQV